MSTLCPFVIRLSKGIAVGQVSGCKVVLRGPVYFAWFGGDRSSKNWSRSLAKAVRLTYDNAMTYTPCLRKQGQCEVLQVGRDVCEDLVE